MTQDVQLVQYQPDQLEILKQFKLPEEQNQFTVLPTEVIEEVSTGKFPIVILHDKEPVGFFVLHSTERVKEYCENPNAMLLTSFSINHSKQGKGFAKNGLSQLEAFITSEFPWCDEILLAVNHKNMAAQNLYKKVGFKDTGARKEGPVGEQYIMSLMFRKI